MHSNLVRVQKFEFLYRNLKVQRSLKFNIKFANFFGNTLLLKKRFEALPIEFSKKSTQNLPVKKIQKNFFRVEDFLCSKFEIFKKFGLVQSLALEVWFDLSLTFKSLV